MESRIRSVCLGKAGSLVLALACACLSMVVADDASANAPIDSFSALPSVTQAGGHPDVAIQFATENRITQKSQSPCNCEDPKDASVHLPAGFIGNPYATPQCSLRADFSAEECPVDSQIGMVEIGSGACSPFLSEFYNVFRRRVTGLVAFKIITFAAPPFVVIDARTGGDYDLTPGPPGTSTRLGLPLERLSQILWGVPAPHPMTRCASTPGSRRATSPPTSASSATRTARRAPRTRTRSSNPAARTRRFRLRKRTPRRRRSCKTRPPATCRSAARWTCSRRRRRRQQRSGLAADDRLRPAQLQPEPLRPADRRPGRRPNRHRRLSQGPAAAEPGDSLAHRVAWRTVALPAGFSINPNAADGKTSCSDAQARSEPRKKRLP